MTKQENEPLDLELVPYVTYVPANTIALEIRATIFELKTGTQSPSSTK